jgi:hypothetical protein
MLVFGVGECYYFQNTVGRRLLLIGKLFGIFWIQNFNFRELNLFLDQCKSLFRELNHFGCVPYSSIYPQEFF